MKTFKQFLVESFNPEHDNQDDVKAVLGWMRVKSPSELNWEFKMVPTETFKTAIENMESSYPQFPKEEARTKKIQKALASGQKPWPIFVDHTDGFIMEGRHRIVAFSRVGMQDIPAVYVSKK